MLRQWVVVLGLGLGGLQSGLQEAITQKGGTWVSPKTGNKTRRVSAAPLLPPALPHAAAGARVSPGVAMSNRRPSRPVATFSNEDASNVPDVPTASRQRAPGPSAEVQRAGTAAAAAAARAAAREPAGGTAPPAAHPDEDATVPEGLGTSEWASRCSNQQQAWQEQLPQLRQLYVSNLPLAMQQHASTRQEQQTRMQARVSRAWELHHCMGADGGQLNADSFTQTSTTTVTYFGLTTVFPVQLPKWQCSCCSASVSPHPSAFGCFPSTPSQPQMWYDVQVHQLYRRLGLLEGLSATGV